RMHQIRAHMASIARPILGDAIYGGSRKLPTCPRLFLHCCRLKLMDLDARQVCLEAELPPALRSFLASLKPL
ncbi:rluC, partial [Symbiodinium pilosum]